MKSQLLNLFVTLVVGLFCGAMLLIGVAIIPFWESLGPEGFRLWLSQNGNYLGNLMVPLAKLSVLGGWVWLITSWKQKKAIRTHLIVVVIAVTLILAEYLFVHKGLNATLMGDSPLTLSEISQSLSHWKSWHWCRVGAGMMAFVASALALTKTGMVGKNG